MIVTVLNVLGALLNLQGGESQINFVGESTAILRASCPSEEAAFVRSLHPTSVNTIDLPSAAVTVEFGNVATTCVNKPISTPCVSHDMKFDPSLFFFVFTGSQGSWTSGPVPAFAVEHKTTTGDILAISSRATSAMPDADTVNNLTGKTSPASDVELTVTVLHGPERVEIPFMGVPNGNAFTVVAAPSPVPPSPLLPPASPPSTPPPSPAGCNSESKLTSTTCDDASCRSSALSGDSYRATNTLDGNTNSFYLSTSGQFTNQWIIYDLLGARRITKVMIGNGQSPFSAKNVKFETSASKNGPWNTEYSFQLPSEPAYQLQSYDVGEGFQTPQYVRFFMTDNYGSASYTKIMEIEFHGC